MRATKFDISREKLEELYVIKNLTAKKIAETYNVYISTVEKRLAKFGITKKRVIKPSYEELYNDYIVKNLSSRQLGKKFKVCFNTVLRWLRDYDITKSTELQKLSHDINAIRTCQKRYKVDYPLQNAKIQKKTSKTIQKKYKVINISQLPETKHKVKQKFLSKYGVKCCLLSPIIQEKSRQKCLEKYDNIYYIASQQHRKKYDDPEFVRATVLKGHETKKRNKSYGSSKEEDRVYEKIKRKYPDTLRQYTNKKLGLHVDFYIPSIDTYIEYQGHWRHGGHPFDKNSSIDLNTLKLWQKKAKTSKYYASAIRCWTILDPEKRDIAKRNNLRYKEIWKRI